MQRQKKEKLLFHSEEKQLRLKKFIIVYQLVKSLQDKKLSEKQSKAIETLDLIKDRKLWHAFSDESLSQKELELMHAKQYKRIAKKINFPIKEWGEAKQLLEVRDALQEEGIQKLLHKKRFFPFKNIGVAAAFLILALGLSLFWLKQEQQTIPKNWITKDHCLSQTLSDGTYVFLNKGSRLTLSEDFNRKQRCVAISGEVFFKVKKDIRKPFIITHGALTTIVKGTAFTISNYSEMSRNVLTVYEGKVCVQNKGKELALLTPNQRLEYDKVQGTFIITTTDAAHLATWTEGGLVFIDADQAELRMRLQQYFSVRIIVEDCAFIDAGKKNVRFNAQFKKGVRIEEVMEQLQLLYGISYTKEKDLITIYREKQ